MVYVVKFVQLVETRAYGRHISVELVLGLSISDDRYQCIKGAVELVGIFLISGVRSFSDGATGQSCDADQDTDCDIKFLFQINHRKYSTS